MISRSIRSACSIFMAILVFFSGIAFAVYADEYDSASLRRDILECRLESAGASDAQEFIDGWMTDYAGDGTADWYALCLARDGEYDFSRYAAALEPMISDPGLRATERQRIALAYDAAGGTGIDIGNIVDETWDQLGVMSEIYALMLINSADAVSTANEAEIVRSLLERQFSDGGWALGGQYSDIDITAMAIQALSAYRSSDAVSQSIDTALSLLSARQRSDGSYQSYGTSCAESCAQVIIALEQLGLDPQSDERFIKNGYTAVDALMSFRSQSGAFAHILGGADNAMATVQAYEAFTAMECSGLYILSEKTVEIELPAEDEAPEPEVMPAVTTAVPEVNEPQLQTTTSAAAVDKPENIVSSKPLAETATEQPEAEAGAEEEIPEDEEASADEPEEEAADETAAPETETETVDAAEELTEAATTVTSPAEITASTSSAESAEATSVTTAEEVMEVNPVTDPPDKPDSGDGWKTVAYVTIGAIFAASAAYPAIRRNFSWKRTAASAAVCLTAAGAVHFINIQTPEEYYSRNLEDIDADSLTVTLSVNCATIADELGGKYEIIPETELVLLEGESVFDILERVLAYNKVTFDYDGNFETDIYITGIDDIYEMDYGGMSGWMYLVNGENPDVGCGAYIPQDGDVIEWKYTLEMGHDLGLEEYK